jgi:EPS-associated MarR family transcriptional regulator
MGVLQPIHGCAPCGSVPKRFTPVRDQQNGVLFVSEERQLKALKVLELQPEISQRQLAAELDVSLGAANYCLKALVEKGWVKLENFQKNPNKLGYLYLLTPMGIAAKSTLTARFLKRKLGEYEALKVEIEELQNQINPGL